MRRVLLVLLLSAGGACGGACGNSKAPEAKAPADGPIATSPPAPAKTAGPRAEGKGFVAEVTAPKESTVGAAAKAQVVIKPTGEYHMNVGDAETPPFPTWIEVKPPAGVDVAKAKQSFEEAAKFTAEEVAFDVTFTPTAAGDKAFTATLSFAVCTVKTCDPKRETLAWNVGVK